LPKGLHDLGVEKMKPRLQERIDSVPDGKYDAVLLGYGLCNNGVAGLTSRNTRIVLPRAHDCITLFLGSRKKYQDCFNNSPGTYYRTTGWIERGDGESVDDVTISQKLGLHMKYEELVQKYGEDNAQYIMETMGDLTANYDKLAFICMGLDCEDHFASIAEKEAREKNLVFEKIQGSMDILRKLVNGEWDDDFLILQPGESVKASHDDDVIRAEKLS
ncbi:MAG: DUF1638 domain-containing protein, partial [Kiritimatiellae bacterium]|nr:DUF1638 domain-containing protein [Kiritimatiellia bacterium]